MLDTIKQTCQGYYNEIPVGTGQAIVKSALYSFAVSVTICNLSRQPSINFYRPIVAAGVAALASSIHALTTPLFNKIFAHHDRLYFPHEIIRLCVDLALVHAVVQQTPLKACVEVFRRTMIKTHVIVWFSTNLFKSSVTIPLWMNDGILRRLGVSQSRIIQMRVQYIHGIRCLEDLFGIALLRRTTPIYVSI